MEDSFRLKNDPEFLKISEVYVVTAKVPENWLRKTKNIPMINPFFAGFVTKNIIFRYKNLIGGNQFNSQKSLISVFS